METVVTKTKNKGKLSGLLDLFETKFGNGRELITKGEWKRL